MNKKGAAGVAIGVILVLVLAAIGGGMFYYFSKITQQIAPEVPATPEAAEQVLAEEIKDSKFCANNPDLDWEVRAKDTLPATAAYRAGYVYLVDKTDGQVISEKGIGTITSTRSDLTDALKCGHKYDVYTKTSQDGNYTAWALPVTFTAQETFEDPVIKDVEVQRATSVIKVRCYDNLISAWMWTVKKSAADGVLNTGYHVVLNDADVNFTSTTNASNMALATKDDVDITCELRTNETDYQSGLNTILALDYSDSTDPSDWNEDEFSIEWDGSKLTRDSDTAFVVDNDRIALTGFEDFWKIPGGVQEDFKKLHILGKTADTGTIDRDLIFRVCGTGTFLSDKDDAVLLQDVCFRDDGATRTEMLTSTARGFRFLMD